MTIPRLIQLTIDGDLSNKIDVTDEVKGTGLTISGDVTATGEIEIADFVTGNVTIGAPGKQFAGILDLENGVPSGITVEVKSDLSSAASTDLNNQAVGGTLKFSGDNAADINNGGAVTGTVTLADGSANSYSGDATFASVSSGGVVQTLNGANVAGDINVTGNISGNIYISDDLTGDVDLRGDLIGSVTVSGALASLGRIFTATFKECAGSISIGKQTDDLTLIHCAGGLTSDGTIEINTSRGNFDAGGTIRVGLEFVPFPLPAITYDGCIRIYDKDPGNGGGDLDGTITVIGCHATDDALTMCIDGDLNGTIDIVQTDCTNQVRPACSFGCP